MARAVLCLHGLDLAATVNVIVQDAQLFDTCFREVTIEPLHHQGGTLSLSLRSAHRACIGSQNNRSTHHH